MPPIRKFDSVLDTLLHGVSPSGAGGSETLELLRSQVDLRAYRILENVLDAALNLSTIGTPAGRQVVYDAMQLEALHMPMWIESRNPATNTMEAFLIEALVEGAGPSLPLSRTRTAMGPMPGSSPFAATNAAA